MTGVEFAADQGKKGIALSPEQFRVLKGAATELTKALQASDTSCSHALGSMCARASNAPASMHHCAQHGKRLCCRLLRSRWMLMRLQEEGLDSGVQEVRSSQVGAHAVASVSSDDNMFYSRADQHAVLWWVATNISSVRSAACASFTPRRMKSSRCASRFDCSQLQSAMCSAAPCQCPEFMPSSSPPTSWKLTPLISLHEDEEGARHAGR